MCVLSPAITTEDDGSLRFTSGRDLVFEAGNGGQVQFMTADGRMDTIGQKVREVVSVWLWEIPLRKNTLLHNRHLFQLKCLAFKVVCKAKV